MGISGCFKRCGFQLFVHLTKVIKRTFGFWRCLLVDVYAPSGYQTFFQLFPVFYSHFASLSSFKQTKVFAFHDCIKFCN